MIPSNHSYYYSLIGDYDNNGRIDYKDFLMMCQLRGLSDFASSQAVQMAFMNRNWLDVHVFCDLMDNWYKQQSIPPPYQAIPPPPGYTPYSINPLPPPPGFTSYSVNTPPYGPQPNTYIPPPQGPFYPRPGNRFF